MFGVPGNSQCSGTLKSFIMLTFPCPLTLPCAGIAGCIVCVGLLTLLLWKVFTTITDRREYARFEEERLKMKFNANSNPIFRQATTTIQNPLFCKGGDM